MLILIPSTTIAACRSCVVWNNNLFAVFFFSLVVVNLDYICEECQYSSCDVTCGEGERSGSKHCVLYDIDLTTIIDEHDVNCPPETCTVQCDMNETTTAFTSMTSQGQLPNSKLTPPLCLVCTSTIRVHLKIILPLIPTK